MVMTQAEFVKMYGAPGDEVPIQARVEQRPPANTQLEMGMEATSLATAAAAIALGLNEEEAVLFMEQAYHLTRGMTPRGKYSTLIELAYKIKQYSNG